MRDLEVKDISRVRALMGVFPVWLDFSEDLDCPNVSGFWSEPAITIALMCSSIAELFNIDFNFAFLPYEHVKADNWPEALIKSFFV